MPTEKWEDYLEQQLADPEHASGYLTACLEEGPDVFLLGLRDVAKAMGGMKKLSDETELAREALYRMLSEEGNPTFSSITSIVSALGIELKFEPRSQSSKVA